MKPKYYALLFAFFVLTVSIACAALMAPPETNSSNNNAAPDEATATNTIVAPTITPTATPKPSKTPAPTKTPIPPTATAASLKEPVANEQYEVRIITSRFLDKVYRYFSDGGGFEYTPKPGYTFLELGIKVTNLKPDKTFYIAWENVYVIDKNNQGWYPNFGGSYAPKNRNEEVNPATIVFDDTYNLSDIVLKDIVYIRAIWAVIDEKPTFYLFGFDTSPLIEVPRK